MDTYRCLSKRTLPARNLTIYVAGNRVSAETGSADVSVSGFLTPSGGPVSGRLFLSSTEGDADLTEKLYLTQFQFIKCIIWAK